MRRLAPLAALALVALAGCTAEEPGTPEPAGPVRAAELRNACQLLGAAELAGTLGGQFTPEERPSERAGGGTQLICVYRSSTVDLVLTASDAPRGRETPRRFVSTISSGDPAARPVDGVGDEATFVHVSGGDVRVLLGAAKNSANRFRAVTLALSEGSDEAKRALAELAAKAMSRM